MTANFDHISDGRPPSMINPIRFFTVVPPISRPAKYCAVWGHSTEKGKADLRGQLCARQPIILYNPLIQNAAYRSALQSSVEGHPPVCQLLRVSIRRQRNKTKGQSSILFFDLRPPVGFFPKHNPMSKPVFSHKDNYPSGHESLRIQKTPKAFFIFERFDFRFCK